MSQAHNIGSRLELFVDDYLIGCKSDLRWYRVERGREPSPSLSNRTCGIIAYGSRTGYHEL
jgi:hypothetical protein